MSFWKTVKWKVLPVRQLLFSQQDKSHVVVFFETLCICCCL